MTIYREGDAESILSRISGPYISKALQTLPPAATAIVDEMDALIDVPAIGTVRITAKRMRSKRGKSINYFWTAERAVVAV